MATFGVVLDACVLVPACLRDTLLTVAERGLYRPHWSQHILDELKSTLVRNNMSTTSGAERLVTHMTIAFDDAMVTDYESLIAGLTNDEKDRHVLAAAIRAAAYTIVTLNLRHFPDDACTPYDIEAQHPDDFLVHQYYLAPSEVVAALRVQAKQLNDPPRSLNDILDTLQHDVRGFCRLLRDHLNIPG